MSDEKPHSKLGEMAVIFVSVAKWVTLAAGVGAVIGLAVAGFLKLLQLGTDAVSRFPYYFVFLPMVLFVSSLLVKYLAPEAKGHGTEKVIEAVHQRSGRISPAVIPVKLVATLVTIIGGGSVGKEGPSAQIGAGMASAIAGLLRFDDIDRKKLAICGISAGFAAVFGTPIAGAIFGVEVLFVGGLMYNVLLPSFISGIIAYQVAAAVGMQYVHHRIEFVPIFQGAVFLEVIAAGIFAGICAVVLVEVLRLGHRLSGRVKVWEPLKGLVGGALLVG